MALEAQNERSRSPYSIEVSCSARDGSFAWIELEPEFIGYLPNSILLTRADRLTAKATQDPYRTLYTRSISKSKAFQAFQLDNVTVILHAIPPSVVV